MAHWDITINEDIWIVDNNHVGIKSGACRPGRYSMSENGAMRFGKWYVVEVARD